MVQTASVARGLLTFVFTDIVGSTRLWERVPEAARRALARHNALVEEAVSAHHGRVFKTVGDACCCVFESPADAVLAAISIQHALSAAQWPEEVGLVQVRAGIHSGIAIAELGDYFGPALNRVARLMSAAHGGQTLVSAATADALQRTPSAGYALVDLGAHRLKDLTEPQHIYQLVAAGLPDDFPPPATLDAHPNNLPSQLSAFVGREKELDDLRDLLGRNRLVTISGLGGIGKTRLALQAAAETIGRYEDGSWLVRLADVEDPSLVPELVARALHVTQVPGQPLEETLVEYLRDRRAFLVLDNAEHVLTATAALSHRLLSECPGISILVTSREPLHIAGEFVLRIGRMVSGDATSLFVNRANLGSSDRYVEHVCERLEGLPLAIEIVAGRIGALSAKQLDEHLDRILPSAVSKDISKDARHRTLRATIEWSYRLLSPNEQRFFAELSVFEGGFGLEACEAVAVADEQSDPAYVLLDALVDKSFVTAEPHGASMRYRLLELLHDFASEKLRESGESQAARKQHFAYFKALADRWGTWTSPDDEESYLGMLAREIPNMRAALTWSLSQPDVTPGLELLSKVALYWQQHCNVSEARSWFARASAAAGGMKSILYAKVLRRAATFATIEDDYSAARDLTAQAMALFEELGDRAGVAEAVHNLAVIEDRSGSSDEAYRLYREALQAFEETGHEVGTITALFNLGLGCKLRGDFEQATAYLERGMSLCNTPQHADRLASFLKLRGEVALSQGALDEASAALEEALSMKRALQNRHDEVEALCSVAALNIRRGDFEDAAHYASEGLRLAHQLEVPSLLIASLELFAVLFAKTGENERAQQVLALAIAMRRSHGYVYSNVDELRPELNAMSVTLPAREVTREQIRHGIEQLIEP